MIPFLLSEMFLKRIGARNKDIIKVMNLVTKHMWPTDVYLNRRQGGKQGGEVKIGAFRRLAQRLHPATIEELTYLTEADCLGAGPFLDVDDPKQFLLKTVEAYGLEAGAWLRGRAKELEVYKERPVPMIGGVEMIAMGYPPSSLPGYRYGDVFVLVERCRDDLGLGKDEIKQLLARTQEIPKAIKILEAELEQGSKK